ncbi:unnamed protein product [Trifolium pratense]|uniref:Uncharacterized protein n=1 Tax=Trifolium pratense TaxID=57577 RepID=A0ACB0KVY3_TRIPR|nr:unnamed protein product [Trifolium pratense]
MPTYAKFMKEILTKKRRYNDDEVIQLDASCSAIIQRTLPTKEKDPGRVTLPVTIGNVNVGKALIDLGSSINLIPLSVIKRVGGLDITRTRMTLQLADKSITRPSGMAEDVLVKVDKFMFPIDFVVMDIEEDDDVPLILGRPFMKTARMMIDIDDGVMKVRVQDEEVSFNLWEAMKHPHEKDMCFKLDATEEAILDVRKQAHQPSSLEQALTESFEALDPEKEEEVESFLKQLDALKEVTPLEAKIEELKKDERPGEVKLDLKTLPSHLKYAFLEEGEKKPVIISNSLSADEEKSLIQILKENKEAIGWSLSDLKGISPSYCMHNIMMEDDYKPVAQPQRRLNPTMKEKKPQASCGIVITHHMEVTIMEKEQQQKFCSQDSFGRVCSKTLMNMLGDVITVKELVEFQGAMKCHFKTCMLLKYLIAGVLISLALFHHHFQMNTFLWQ